MLNSEKFSIERHNREIQENLKSWDRKELLRLEYRRFYREIESFLNKEIQGKTAELGSGIGKIKEIIPDCILTDLFLNPWIHQQESAYALSFEAASLSNLIIFDVWHHLEYPGEALKEFHRVLKKGGRVIIFEPAMGLMGKIVYGCFHPEPLGLLKEISWKASKEVNLNETQYYAAQGNAWRIFRNNNESEKINSLMRIQKVKTFSALNYLLSGGFSGRQLSPTSWRRIVQKLETFLDLFPFLFASRMLIVLEKK